MEEVTYLCAYTYYPKVLGWLSKLGWNRRVIDICGRNSLNEGVPTIDMVQAYMQVGTKSEQFYRNRLEIESDSWLLWVQCSPVWPYTRSDGPLPAEWLAAFQYTFCPWVLVIIWSNAYACMSYSIITCFIYVSRHTSCLPSFKIAVCMSVNTKLEMEIAGSSETFALGTRLLAFTIFL
jgi:hypothetical protein